MPINLILNNLGLDALLEYTEWERQLWLERIRKHGSDVLKLSLGPNGDGRFTIVGELIRHIFSAEKRYVERITGRSLTDTSLIPADNVEALFQSGQESRNELKDLLQTFPGQDWDKLQELKLMNSTLTASPKKLVVHALIHEIRHWAQIGTIFRMNGLGGEFHDFLFSPVLGGELRRG